VAEADQDSATQLLGVINGTDSGPLVTYS